MSHCPLHLWLPTDSALQGFNRPTVCSCQPFAIFQSQIKAQNGRTLHCPGTTAWELGRLRRSYARFWNSGKQQKHLQVLGLCLLFLGRILWQKWSQTKAQPKRRTRSKTSSNHKLPMKRTASELRFSIWVFPFELHAFHLYFLFYSTN